MTLNTATVMSTSDPGRHLDDACTAVTGEIARIDGKASLLLAFTGAVLAGLAGLAGKKLPLPAQLAGGAAGLALAAAAVLLLLVVRPISAAAALFGRDSRSGHNWTRPASGPP
ncbi:hypothetical protein ACFXEL_34350 [Streptomyces sp. NPDC059382]|uniref:hypothetical protein n=1 Tax=Streptomyces sp. NPDC059382 TaxID=3346816 RepID=UPI0036A0B174